MNRHILLGVLFGVSAFIASAAERPNIVYILADDLGYSDVGFNGARFYETPNIDRLASQGRIFTSAYTGGPNCAPTRACFISGMYTPRHLIYQPGGASKGDPRHMKFRVPMQKNWQKDMPEDFKNLDPRMEIRTELAPSFVSLAEMVNDAGYTTARYGKWHLGPDTQGFDISSPDGVLSEHQHRQSFYRDPEVADRLTDAGVAFIEEHRDEPFFLYVSHYDVHSPFVAQEDVVAKYAKKLEAWNEPGWEFNATYAAMIEAVDRSVGRIVQQIEAQGLSEKTLIVFTSDNGGVSSMTSNLPLRAGKGSLYEGGVRVSTCMRWDGVIEPGTRNDTPITSVDWMPTLAELVGAAVPTSQPVDGVSFAPLLNDNGALAERAMFWHYPLYLDGKDHTNFLPYPGGSELKGVGFRATPASAIRRGDWKLVEYFEDGRIELYNVVEDIGERNDQSSNKRELARELHDELKAWRTETNAIVPGVLNPYYEGRR